MTNKHISSKTPLDLGSARRRKLTTHNTQVRQTSVSWAGFKPTIPASEQPQTYALDSAVTGFFFWTSYVLKLVSW